MEKGSICRKGMNGSSFLSQHDRGPAHTADTVKAYLARETHNPPISYFHRKPKPYSIQMDPIKIPGTQFSNPKTDIFLIVC